LSVRFNPRYFALDFINGGKMAMAFFELLFYKSTIHQNGEFAVHARSTKNDPVHS